MPDAPRDRLELLAIVRVGDASERLAIARDPATPDEIRLAFKDAPSAWVRATAVSGATSDETRLAFEDDPNAWVRAVAVSDATSDETRLAFKDDANAEVRVEAVSGATSDETRLAFARDESPDVRSAAYFRMTSAAVLNVAHRQELDASVRKVIRSRVEALAPARGRGYGMDR